MEMRLLRDRCWINKTQKYYISLHGEKVSHPVCVETRARFYLGQYKTGCNNMCHALSISYFCCGAVMKWRLRPLRFQWLDME